MLVDLINNFDLFLGGTSYLVLNIGQAYNDIILKEMIIESDILPTFLTVFLRNQASLTHVVVAINKTAWWIMLSKRITAIWAILLFQTAHITTINYNNKVPPYY